MIMLKMERRNTKMLIVNSQKVKSSFDNCPFDECEAVFISVSKSSDNCYFHNTICGDVIEDNVMTIQTSKIMLNNSMRRFRNCNIYCSRTKLEHPRQVSEDRSEY